MSELPVYGSDDHNYRHSTQTHNNTILYSDLQAYMVFFLIRLTLHINGILLLLSYVVREISCQRKE